jgi:hypothetical protein
LYSCSRSIWQLCCPGFLLTSLQIIVPLQSPDKGMFWVFAIRALVRIPCKAPIFAWTM